MNNLVNNQMSGVEYSEVYRNLRREVSEQNTKTAQLPQKTRSDNEKRAGDKVEFNNNASVTVAAKLLNKEDAQNTFNSLIGAIRENQGSAYEAQNNLLASRIAVLLDS